MLESLLLPAVVAIGTSIATVFITERFINSTVSI